MSFMTIESWCFMVFTSFLFAASIAVLIEKKLKKEDTKGKDFILSYFTYTFLITMLTNFFIYTIHGGKNIFYQSIPYSYDLGLQYMLFSFLLAIILPCLWYILCRIIHINIEVKERKKNVKKNTKNTSKISKTKH